MQRDVVGGGVVEEEGGKGPSVVCVAGRRKVRTSLYRGVVGVRAEG